VTFIGLHGKAGAGKDTVAMILSGEHDFIRMAFATPIKDALIAMFGLEPAWVHDPARKDKPIDWLGQTPRKLMQTLGTEWGRHLVSDDLWVRTAGRRLKYASMVTGKVVVTDVRYENEASWVRENGGVVWHIERDTSKSVRAHSSEAGIAVQPGVDSVLDNNLSVDHLRGRVRQALAGELVVVYP